MDAYDSLMREATVANMRLAESRDQWQLVAIARTEDLRNAELWRDRWHLVATHLYDALAVLKKTRGVHIDNIEQVLDALQAYEKAIDDE